MWLRHLGSRGRVGAIAWRGVVVGGRSWAWLELEVGGGRHVAGVVGGQSLARPGSCVGGPRRIRGRGVGGGSVGAVMVAPFRPYLIAI